MTIHTRAVLLVSLISFVLVACDSGPTEAGPDERSVRVDAEKDRIVGIGGTTTLSARLIGGDVSVSDPEDFAWSSSDESVAIVDAAGIVTAVSAGTASISARFDDAVGQTTITVWREGELTYRSDDGILLSALLRLPEGNGPFPAIVTVHGSEAARKENYQPQALIDAGFAVLSYDKRGVGGSGGIYTSIGPGNSFDMFDLLSDDAAAGVEELVLHAEIDSTAIGLMGWSQAGWIIPRAARKSDHVQFMVNVVGPTMSIGEEIYYSSLTGDSGTGPFPGGRSWEEIYELVRDYNGPTGFSAIGTLRVLDVPGLWVLGGQDRSIPTPLVIEDLEALVADYGKDYTYHLYPEGNHGIRNATTGEPIPFIERDGGVNDWIRSVISR